MRRALITVLILWWPVLPAAAEVDLSPASWPPGELELYAELQDTYERPHPAGKGRHGVVVGAGSALAVRAGLEALKQGGSAADAALVTSLAQIVVEAGAWVSFAGTFSMTYYDAESGRIEYLDGCFDTVRGETDPLTIPPRGTPSGRSALVSGFMAAVEAAHDRFGVLPWGSLFEPSIYFAEEGFKIDSALGGAIESRADVLTRLPATRAIFTSPDGDLYRTGEVLEQPELAKTLRKVAQRGSRYMYRGKWARRLVKAVRAEGGKMKMKDLRRYRATWGDAASTRYREFEIFAPGAPAEGGRWIIDALERVEGEDLAALGHYERSADALHSLMEAIRSVAFGIVSNRAHSEAVIAIDEAGNVASIVHSISTSSWGTTGIFVDGVSIPDYGARHQGQILEIGPGNRIPESVSPLIVLRDGDPYLASSALGSSLMEEAFQRVVNVLDYGMSPKTAQKPPTFRQPVYGDPELPLRVTRGDFPSSLIEQVQAMGVPIVVQSPAEADAFGYWIGAVIEPGSGRRVGATHDLFNGCALGY